jgi:enamine deaminase RidA (YjgF/YER057c/UK114 family)
MKKKLLITSALLLMLSPINVYANTEDSLGGITIKETPYAQAELLDGSQYYSGVGTYIKDTENKINLPLKETIKKALIHLLSQLESDGVNIEEVVSNSLIYEIINVEVEGALATAFIEQPLPKIYMYGNYSKPLTEKAITNTTLHEYGHYFEKYFMTYEDKKEYRSIRKIPAEIGNGRELPWKQRFEETFAEDFRCIFNPTMPNRASLGELSTTQQKDIRNLIVAVLKRKTSERIYTTDLQKFTVENKSILATDILLYGSMYNSFMASNLSGSSMLNWSTNYLSSIDPEFKVYIKSFDKEHSMLEHSGIFPTTLAEVKTSDMSKEVSFLSNIVKINTTNKKKAYWENFLSQNTLKNPAKTTELDDALAILAERKVLDSKTSLTQAVTRQEVAHLLYKSLELNGTNNQLENTSFKDIPNNHKYTKGIYTLRQLGIMQGTEKESFGWNKPVTKEQIASILATAYKLETTNKSVFKDINKSNENTKDSINALSKLGVIKGDQKGNFNPKQNVTRSDFMLLLNKVYLKTLTEQEQYKYSPSTTATITNWSTNISNSTSKTWTNGDLLEFIHNSSIQK